MAATSLKGRGSSLALAPEDYAASRHYKRQKAQVMMKFNQNRKNRGADDSPQRRRAMDMFGGEPPNLCSAWSRRGHFEPTPCSWAEGLALLGSWGTTAEPPASAGTSGTVVELSTPVGSWDRLTVWPISTNSPNVPSPPWNKKGPDSYKDELIPVSTSSFSRSSHSMSSTTSSSSPSSSSPLLLVSHFRCFYFL